ncbi:MAG: FAD:protein FMN transferase [Bacteroidetes bacterium]|nr:FAD:protein FMN transferase [Bacteroidota bacterium]
MYRFIFVIVLILPFFSCNSRATYASLDGFALGTTYHIVYEPPTALLEGEGAIPALVAQVFADIDSSLSIYNKESVISKVNRNEPVVLDSLFIRVFNRGKELYTLTLGAFDMAAAPYFDLWGFGLQNRVQITQAKLDSIAVFAGMDKISIIDGKIEKTDPRVSLSANAIAKGFCSDLIAARLKDAGVVNLLVEVGGEIFCTGLSPKRQAWSIGIDAPEYGNYIPGNELQSTLLLSGRGLATSGNYRNYYEQEGLKYGHIVDPSTGNPVQHSLLSATVLAPDCMTADALATAFMVMGLEKSKNFLDAHPDLDAYLIYSDAKGFFESYATYNVTFINNR